MKISRLIKLLWQGSLRVHFSQYGEDVILHKLFGSKFRDGFYIDVGAHHPFRQSNTAYLWLLGWNGVNVDASAAAIKVFNQIRSQDVNLWSAVVDEDTAAKQNQITLYSNKEIDLGATCDEALAVIRAVGHPALRLVLDVKSLVAESRQTHEPVPDIIRRVGGDVAYVQANDERRGHPGSGPTDFVPICQALRDIGYDGWVSMEPFEFGPGPDIVAREGLACVERAWAATAPNRTDVHGPA